MSDDGAKSDLRKEKPDTVATPEGDGEFAPDQPIKPVHGQQKVPAIDTNRM